MYKQMSSVSGRVRQVSNDTGYFISLASVANQIYATPDTSSVVAPWASTALSNANFGSLGTGALSTVIFRASTVGTLFKDMGKSVISSGTHFRKIQLVLPQGTLPAVLANAGTTSTFGVGGSASLSGMPDFLTGYVRLGFEGQGTPAPLASFGR
jgi:hypothetical protein